MITNDDVARIKHIYDCLIKWNRISLFVHENPDYDALGSAFALKEHFKTLNIRCEIVGLNGVSKEFKSKIFNIKRDVITDDYIKNSIGLILDTANASRILSQKHKLCKELYRIDHHPHKENIGNFEWINIDFSSTCEMVGWFILYNGFTIQKKIANYLYAGILTDSGNLMYPSTQKTTYELVSYLYSFGLDKQEIQDKIYLRTYKDFQTDQILRNKIKIRKPGYGYIVVHPPLKEKLKLDRPNNKVYLLNNIEELKIWYMIFYDTQNKIWKGSLRSRELDVSKIASMFYGGGHKHAAGFRLYSNRERFKLNKEIKKMIKSAE